jgi:hypothetical protein
MHYRLARIVDSVTADNFKEKSDEILRFLSMPHGHISGVYSLINQANYMIGKGRNKLTDEELREALRWEIDTSLQQLETYGPIKRANLKRVAK